MYFPMRQSPLKGPEPDNTFWTDSTPSFRDTVSELLFFKRSSFNAGQTDSI